jgi:hypothetical protein
MRNQIEGNNVSIATPAVYDRAFVTIEVDRTMQISS